MLVLFMKILCKSSQLRFTVVYQMGLEKATEKLSFRIYRMGIVCCTKNEYEL